MRSNRYETGASFSCRCIQFVEAHVEELRALGPAARCGEVWGVLDARVEGYREGQGSGLGRFTAGMFISVPPPPRRGLVTIHTCVNSSSSQARPGDLPAHAVGLCAA